MTFEETMKFFNDVIVTIDMENPPNYQYSEILNNIKILISEKEQLEENVSKLNKNLSGDGIISGYRISIAQEEVNIKKSQIVHEMMKIFFLFGIGNISQQQIEEQREEIAQWKDKLDKSKSLQVTMEERRDAIRNLSEEIEKMRAERRSASVTSTRTSFFARGRAANSSDTNNSASHNAGKCTIL